MAPNKLNTHPQDISIQDFTYDLPSEKIALYPLAERDFSKLLIYKEKAIQSDLYTNIDRYLPENSLLVFNNTKVINARINFKKSGGSVIEIFCLEPLDEYSIAMNRKGTAKWKCMIGGASKWKKGPLQKELKVNNEEFKIEARLTEKLPDTYVVEFTWQPINYTFAEIIDVMGTIPLPPYIKRNVEVSDDERYQTVYAEIQGSVAAPTAGLHFTASIFEKLKEKNIKTDFITLHVGAGTFKPVKTPTMALHEMHAEWIDITTSTIEKIIHLLNDTIIAVGTTSLRTLESLYWLGVKAFLYPDISHLRLTQWEAYETDLTDKNISCKDALTALIKWLKNNNLTRLFTQTQIIIAPGYHFKMVKAIITNFHQPQSTLLLLVAAAIGNDWKKVYEYALHNDYRFLSYGDGSLIFI